MRIEFKTGDLIFSRSKSLVSRLIGLWTRWTHVRVMIDERRWVEAGWPRVRVGSIYELVCGKEEWVVLRPEKVPEGLVEYLLSKVGKRYDWKGLLSFVIRRNVQNKSWYFCSELVAEAFERCGYPLIRKKVSWTKPDDLYTSMKLKEVL